MSKRRLPSPAMLVAICALVVGLTGSAVALQGKNSVKSNDIAPSAVKASDIHKLAVHPAGARPVQDQGRRRVRSRPPPRRPSTSVARRSPSRSRRAAWSRSTRGSPARSTAAATTPSAQVHLFEPTVLPNNPAIMQFNNPDPQIRFTVPGQADTGAGGVANPARGGFLVFSPVNPGKYTFSLRFSNPGGGAATFINAGLWAGVVQ